MSTVSIPPASGRVLTRLLPALLGDGEYTPGRPGGQRALADLGGTLCRWLEQNPRLILLGGDPLDPMTCHGMGLAAELVDPALAMEESGRDALRLHLAGFWRDRRLALICLRQGLTVTEFDHLYHLLSRHAGKGLLLRSRLFEEQSRGHLAHVSLIFLDDLPEIDLPLVWPARVCLAWLHRDLNLLSRSHGLPMRQQLDWREQLLKATVELSHQSGRLVDFFANLDLIAEEIDKYDKDELVFSLLEHLDSALQGSLCLQLCALLGRLQPQADEQASAAIKTRHTAIKWIARRLAEGLLEEDQAGPEHLHALVLHKILLYEEIPKAMRPRVASLQVLTSFLANPQKYFNEVEGSHSPEVLETRLWRTLEMLPKLIEALRFDVARQVLEFAQRFGPTFDLHNRPEIMARSMEAAAGVLSEGKGAQQSALMQTLPHMGKAGIHLLIDLADHRNRSVRRTAVDALLKIGQPIVPVLFATYETKQGWHYLRNMLLLLTQLKVGGPRVEKLFRDCLAHSEANVRKEALSGLARLAREKAARQVTEALSDVDPDVRKRAAACLGLTGVADAKGYQQLAELLAAKDCSEELAVQIIASLNRIKPQPQEGPALESALLGMLGSNGLFGIGGRKGIHSQTLRVAVVQALGFVGTGRCRKVLRRLQAEQSGAMASALAETFQRLTERGVRD